MCEHRRPPSDLKTNVCSVLVAPTALLNGKWSRNCSPIITRCRFDLYIYFISDRVVSVCMAVCLSTRIF